MSEDEKPPEPPQPPEFQRKTQFFPLQAIGVPLLMVLPVLALFNVFGQREATASQVEESVTLELTYPDRFRYRNTGTLQVDVRNTSDSAIASLEVHFDREYIECFSNVSFTPDVDTVTDTEITVSLENLEAGETKSVCVFLEAEKYWRHEGRVRAIAASTELAAAELSTLVYP